MKGNKFKSIKNVIAVILLVSMLLTPLTVLAETSGSTESSGTESGTSQTKESENNNTSASSNSQDSESSGSTQNSTENNSSSDTGTDSASNNEAGSSKAGDNTETESKSTNVKSESNEVVGSGTQETEESIHSPSDDNAEIDSSEDDESIVQDTSSNETPPNSQSKSGSSYPNNLDNNNPPTTDYPLENLEGNTYKAELEDPGDLTVDEAKDMTMKFTEIGLHNLTLIFISIPDEFKINSVDDPIASGGNTWKSSYSGQEIKLEADEVEPLGWFSDDRLIFGDWVSVSFNLTPKEEGDYTFETSAEWTHHKYEKIGQIGIIPIFGWVRHDNPNSRHGDDPVVQVKAAADEPNGNGSTNGAGPANGFSGGGGGGFTGFNFEPQLGGIETPETLEQALTIDPEEPLASPGDYLVLPPENPESELEPIIDVEFVLNGTAEDLLEALAAYEVLLAYFDEFWEEMSEEEYARHLIDLSAAWAAMQILDASLQLEQGEDIDLDILLEAYELAMDHINEHGEHLTTEQMEAAAAVMEAVAQLHDSLTEILAD